MNWGRPTGLPHVVGTDPGAGTAHPIPTGARAFFFRAVGTGPVAVRVFGSTSLTGLLTAAFLADVGITYGPFDISPQSDTHVQVGEVGAAAVTAYYISFTRG